MAAIGEEKYNPDEDDEDRSVGEGALPKRSNQPFKLNEVENLLTIINQFWQSPEEELSVDELKLQGAPDNAQDTLIAIADAFPDAGYIELVEFGERVRVAHRFTAREINQIVQALCDRPLKTPADQLEPFRTKVSRLDDLLCGGFWIPRGRGTSVLIAGHPGAGKSTLALLLATEWAKQGKVSLYCALEQDIVSLRGTAQTFGCFPESEDAWSWIDSDHPTKPKSGRGAIVITGLMAKDRAFSTRIRALEQYLGRIKAWATRPLLVVVDSLDVFAESALARAQFLRLKNLLDLRSNLSIMIMEQGLVTPQAFHMEEFVSDTVIEMGTTVELGYLLRYLEIKKARYQNHILGKHQLKIEG